MIQFFADTASIDEITYSFGRGVNDGITTNPKILEATGNLTGGVTQAFQDILDAFPGVPVSLEVDLRGVDLSDIGSQSEAITDVLLKQAYELSELGSDVVVKIPICEGGLEAVKALSAKSIKTNVTACMRPFQALCAVDAGATYVSLFANRMLDAVILEQSGSSLDVISQGGDWKSIVSSNKDSYFESAWAQVLEDIAYTRSYCDANDSQLIVGSIRDPFDIHRIVKAAPHIITIPTKIVEGLDDILALKNTQPTISGEGHSTVESLDHPLTTATIIEFEESARRYLNQHA